MVDKIRRAAVLGAGTMGCQIAAHLSNVGISVLLLDIVPEELTDEEKRKNLSLDDREVRDRFARLGIKRALEMEPPPFYDKEFVSLIEIGNFEDDLEKIHRADWIIEAVIENFEIKRSLLERVDNLRRKGSIVSTNTSGISINALKEGRSEDFRRNFLGTHFFNPPRYMKLLEIIPSRDTDDEIISFFTRFGEKVLGKGVVLAKDTPNFIANRIGVFGFMHIMKTMLDMGLTVEEVDKITGRAMGRPRTATFRTADLVGIDVLSHVARNVYENVKDDERKEIFKPPEFLEEMIERGWLGDKTGGGFYKKVKTDGESERFALDVHSMEYRPREKVTFPSVERALQEEDVGARIRVLVSGSDRGAEFAWRTLSELLIYSANRVPEISDNILNIDRAMKWGFNWRMGPFEMWDAIGIKEIVNRLEKEGREVPELVENLLKSGKESFYREELGKTFYIDVGKFEYEEIKLPPEFILLSSLKSQGKVVTENTEASLIDLGDGVACLEFHTRANALGPGTFKMMEDSLEIVRRDFIGLVIGNQGRHFCAGANLALLLMSIQEEEWDEVEMMVKRFQEINMKIKYFEKPIVAAPFGRTLGGGCEICLHSSRIQAAAETYMGLVEISVGLLPAGGGTKEMLIRHMERIPQDTDVDVYPLLRRILEIIGMAKYSMSAWEAKKLGFLRDGDGITVNGDFLIYDAKQVVIDMVKEGYRPPIKRKVKVTGENGFAFLKMLIYNLLEGGFITEHESLIATEIAKIITGGNVPSGTLVDEEKLLEMERESFLKLCGTQKTQERIEHMLLKGKPLRN
jgi:3-hydroxyacyl-CoA dehydrogenase